MSEPSIRIETDLKSYKDVKFDPNKGHLELGGRKYEVLVEDDKGEYKKATSKLNEDQLYELVDSIQDLFEKTELEFESLENLVIDDKGVHDETKKEGSIKQKGKNLEALSQKVTSLAKGKAVIKSSPFQEHGSIERKGSGKEEETSFKEKIDEFLNPKKRLVEEYDVETISASPSGNVRGAITSFGNIDARRVKDNKDSDKDFNFLSNYYEKPDKKDFKIPMSEILKAAEIEEGEGLSGMAQAKTMEHFYQAFKVLGINDPTRRAKAFNEVLKAKTPEKAREVAEGYKEKWGGQYWSDTRVEQALKVILIHKFIDFDKDPPTLTEEGKKLSEVRSEEWKLIEGILPEKVTQLHGDQRCAMELTTTKGGYAFVGQNILGKMLMKVGDLILDEFEVREK